MRRSSLFLILLITFVIGTSYADSGSRIKAAEELLNAMHIDKALQKTIEQMLEVQLQQKPAMQPYKNVMLEFLNKHMSYDSLKDDLVKLYADAFNEDELHEITKFYKTPTGQKTIEKLPELSSKGAQLGAAKVQNNISELKEMIKKESERIQKLQNQ